MQNKHLLAGINITYRLEQLFDLRDTKGGLERSPPSGPAGAAFAQLLTHEPHAFEEVYVATFECLDREWLAANASYMQFPMVMDGVFASVKKAMLTKPTSAFQLRQTLKL